MRDQWLKKIADINKKSITYYTKGMGKPIVLLHGYLDSSQIWNEIGSKLATNHKVIVIDLPGHGRSDTWPPIHTMDFMAEIVLKVIKHEDIYKVCIVGHSLGGYVALAFADNYPLQTDSLILINSDPFPDKPERIKKRDREIALIKSGKKELLLALSNINPSNDPDQDRKSVV
jgi:pimeloyl-ACP methyl ester carboxylesterase